MAGFLGATVCCRRSPCSELGEGVFVKPSIDSARYLRFSTVITRVPNSALCIVGVVGSRQVIALM